ncbi:MAG: hypothetical protein R3250_08750 [Melioribacteraceae bacterium]|nr:hypothetical protein [Melioribacteraceae bacterium]
MRLLLALLLVSFLFISCNDTITDSPSELITLEKKPPKPDPEADLPPELPILDAGEKHIIAATMDKVYLWNTTNYELIWTYDSDNLPKVGLVNISDGSKEVIILERLQEGRGRNKSVNYYFSIFYQNDSEPQRYFLGEFDSYYNCVWDMKIGDVDNDSQDEIIVVWRDRLEIFEIDNLDVEPQHYTYELPLPIQSISPWEGEIVDYNDDGSNDGIFIAFTNASWLFYSNGVGKYGDPYTESIGSLNLVKASNLNSESDIEVIGGGSVNRLIAWDLGGKIISTSNDFGDYHYTWAFDIADLDHDAGNGKEILVGVNDGGMHLYRIDDNGEFVGNEVVSNLSFSINGLKILDEAGVILTATSNGLGVYKYVSDSDIPLITESPVDGIIEDFVCQ